MFFRVVCYNKINIFVPHSSNVVNCWLAYFWSRWSLWDLGWAPAARRPRSQRPRGGRPPPPPPPRRPPRPPPTTTTAPPGRNRGTTLCTITQTYNRFSPSGSTDSYYSGADYGYKRFFDMFKTRLRENLTVHYKARSYNKSFTKMSRSRRPSRFFFNAILFL